MDYIWIRKIIIEQWIGKSSVSIIRSPCFSKR